MVKRKEDYIPITDYKTFRKQYDYGDPNYSIYYKYFKRPISYPLTWLIYRYTSLRPNTLTYIGFVFALVTFLFFAMGVQPYLILAGISFFVCQLFDDFDGVIARSKNIRSRRGGWLDILAGYIGKFIILSGISIGAFNSTGDPLYLILGLVTVVGFSSVAEIDHVSKIRYSVVMQKKLKFSEHKPDPKTLAGKLSILSEIVSNSWEYLLIITAIIGAMTFFLWVSAIYYLVYPILLFFYLNYKHRND